MDFEPQQHGALMARPVVSRTKVLLADDHRLVREAIAAALPAESFSVTMAEDFDTALSAIRRSGGFDIVMLDVHMPGMRGVQAVRTAVRANAPGAVVIFSGKVTPEFVRRSLSLGARGYIPKTLALPALTNAIDLVVSGETFLPASILGALDSPALASPTGAGLSTQEFLVLESAAHGKKNKEIAEELGLSEMTVKMHMRNVCTKLNAKNRTHAAMIARQHNLI